jgi:hypothetical protein
VPSLIVYSLRAKPQIDKDRDNKISCIDEIKKEPNEECLQNTEDGQLLYSVSSYQQEQSGKKRNTYHQQANKD